MPHLIRLFTFFIFLGTSLITAAQTAPVALYFSSNQSKLSEPSKEALDQILASWRENEKQTISIDGHSDQHGNATYNLALSKARAEAAANYLVAHDVPRAQLTIDYHGEAQPSAGPARSNRRVDLTIKPMASLAAEVADLEVDSMVTDTLPVELAAEVDTVLIGDQGVEVHIPAGALGSVSPRDFSFTSELVVTPEKMIKEELYTVAENGDWLESAGMYRFDPSQNGESFEMPEDADQPITVKVPVPPTALGEDGNPKPMFLWSQDEEGRWVKQQTRIQTEQIDGEWFYLYNTTGRGFFGRGWNLDCPLPCRETKYKVKAKRGESIEDIVATASNVNGVWDIEVKRKGRMAKFRAPAQLNLEMSLDVKRSNGQIVSVAREDWATFAPGKGFGAKGKCRRIPISLNRYHKKIKVTADQVAVLTGNVTKPVILP